MICFQALSSTQPLQNPGVNASIGIAINPENGRDSKTLLRNADAAMYAVKRAGKGGYGK